MVAIVVGAVVSLPGSLATSNSAQNTLHNRCEALITRTGIKLGQSGVHLFPYLP